jgi:capsular exopolysaccharide synthesis family protein
MANSLDEIVDFKQFFFKLINNWHFILISLSIAFIIAFAYNRYSVEYFKVETSILIEDDNSLKTASDLLYDKTSSKNKSLENKELMLKSYPLIYKTLSELRFDIAYFIEGNIKVTETYEAPIIVKCIDSKPIRGKQIKITLIDDNSFYFTDIANKKEEVRNFNEDFLFNNVVISVEYNIQYPVNELDMPITIVKFFDLQLLSLSYKKKIKVYQEDRESTIINISMLTEDEKKGVVFLNKLTRNFIQNDVLEKNLAFNNTVKFINEQLINMSDSLALIEQQIQDYKNSNQVTDLSVKAQSIYANIVSLETELARTRTLNNYFDYLTSYLLNGENLEGVSVPTSFGVNDEGLNSLISQLVEIQIKKNILIDGGQVNNPAIVQYNRQSKQLVLNLQEAIKTSKSANNLLLNNYQNRISKMEQSLSSIPQVEMELLNIERLQSISENLYIFLLQKRAEAMITSSSNVSDTKVLEPSNYFNKSPVTPNTKKSYLIALLFGLLIPVLYIFILDLLNDTIITRMDLEALTKVPILGIIGRNYSGYDLLSKKDPKSPVYEGFRALRSNLNFLNPNQDKQVYLVTSSVSGEGKTYIAENLSIVFAKSGKKTLVIGADLRRPKLYSDFGFDNTKGISSHVLSDVALKEVILRSEIENLDILVAGPLPPNPSDALLTEKFSMMMENLRSIYDIIVLDTPPLGLVADALTLMNYSDINIYVTRQSYTKKGLLTYMNDMYTKRRLNHLHIVFNDVKEGSGAYGYGYGYGSGYGYGYGNSSDSNYFDSDEGLE